MRHRKKVYFACKGFFSEPQRAEDATQETFLRAYGKIRSYQGGDFAAWLTRIARNVCIDEWRRGRLDPVVENSELAERVAAPALEPSELEGVTADAVIDGVLAGVPVPR